MSVRTTVKPGGGWISLGRLRGVDVVRHEVGLPGLDPRLNGMRIVHVTDLHAHRYWHPAWDVVHRHLADDPPELVLFTGDFVEDKLDHRPAWPLVEKFCAGLRAKLGVFGILGNHDSDLLPLLGVPKHLHLLHGRVARVTHRDARIDLVGLPGIHRDDLTAEVIDAVPPKHPADLRIVLSHYPDAVRSIGALQSDLVFAGHTHGGQICLPGRRPLITHDALPFEQAAGVHRVNDSYLIVNRGLGFSGYAVRTFCPAEMGEIVLTVGS